MTDPDRAVRRIAARAAAIKATELDDAHDRLDDLSPEQRAVVDAFADGLVDRLLDAPQDALADADDRTLQAAVDLFGSPDATRA